MAPVGPVPAPLTEARDPSSGNASTPAPHRWHAHPFNRAALYRLAGALAWLPRPARLGLARGVGGLAAPLFPAERAALRAALGRFTAPPGARALDPSAIETLVRRTLRDFAMCFSDLVSTNRRPAAWLLAHVLGARTGTEALDDLRGGAVLLSAHVGSWELAGRLLARQRPRPTHVVVDGNEAPALARWVRRDGEGLRFVPRTRPTLGLELVAALRRGDVVALHGDRALGSPGDLAVPFFGAPAGFPTGPFRLARAAGVPVVPAYCVLDPGDPGRRYRVIVKPPIAVPADGEPAALARWVVGLEDVVRAHPTQWFNFFDIWRPPGG